MERPVGFGVGRLSSTRAEFGAVWDVPTQYGLWPWSEDTPGFSWPQGMPWIQDHIWSILPCAALAEISIPGQGSSESNSHPPTCASLFLFPWPPPAQPLNHSEPGNGKLIHFN